MTSSSIVALFFAVMLFVANPGPGIVALVSTSLGQGFRKGIAISFGMILGDIVYMLIAVYGLSVAAHALGGFFIVVRFAGAAYLIYLGVRLWRHGVDLERISADRHANGSLRTFTAGLLTSLGNPKTIAFYVGFMPNFLDLAHMTNGDVAIAVATIFVASFAVVLIYASLAARAREFLTASHRRKMLNRTAGAVMIGAGLAVAAR